MYHCPRKPKIIPCYDIEKGIPTPYYKKQQHRLISFLCSTLMVLFFVFIIVYNLEKKENIQTEKDNVWIVSEEQTNYDDSLLNAPDYVEVAPPPRNQNKQIVLQPDYKSNDKNVESNLKEIFSINPIIILSIDEEIGEFETILLNLNIHPKPKVINLSKHGNFKNIIDYLKNINENKEIPRLFIGGGPIATEQELLEINKQNQLSLYLKEKGRGLISIE